MTPRLIEKPPKETDDPAPPDECEYFYAFGATVLFSGGTATDTGTTISIPVGGTVNFNWDLDVEIDCNNNGNGTCRLCVNYSIFEKINGPNGVTNQVYASGAAIQINGVCNASTTVHIALGSITLSWNANSTNNKIYASVDVHVCGTDPSNRYQNPLYSWQEVQTQVQNPGGSP